MYFVNGFNLFCMCRFFCSTSLQKRKSGVIEKYSNFVWRKNQNSFLLFAYNYMLE